MTRGARSPDRPRARPVASRCLASLAALVLSHAVPCDARAEAAAVPRDPCASVALPPDTSRDFVALHRAFRRVVRPEPGQALRIACDEGATARDADERAQSRVDLAASLARSSRDDEAIAILDAVVDAPPPDGRVRAEALLRRGGAWTNLRDMRKAGADFAAARAALAAAGGQDDPLYAEILAGTANAKQSALDLDGADRDLDEAAALLRRLSLERGREAADVLNVRTMVAFARQDFGGTIRSAEAELAMTEAIGGLDDRERLDPLVTLGAVKSMTGDFAGAEAALREGLRLADLREDTAVDTRLGLLQNLATFHLDRVQPAEALPVAERALVLAERHYGPDSAALMRVHLTLASVHAELARYPEALRDYERAAALDAAHAASYPVLQRARLYLRLAQLDLKLGDREGVRDALAQVDRLLADQPKLDYWRGWRSRLGCKLAGAEGDWTTADARCGEAITRFATVLDAAHPLVLEVLVGRCYAQTRGRLPGDACERVEERLRDTNAMHRMVRVVALDALALRERGDGRLDAALALRVRMLAAARDIAAPDPLWAAQFALAESLSDTGDRRLAILFGKQAVASIEDMRASFAADREREERGFLADKFVVYRRLAAWLLDDGRVPEAITVLRLLKREEFYDFTERATERGAAPDDARASMTYGDEETALLRRLDVEADSEARTRVSGEVDRLSRLRDAKSLTPDEAARLDALLAESRQHEQATIDALERFIVDGRADPSPIPARRAVTRMRGGRDPALARDEAEAYFFVADARLQLLVLHRGGVERRVIDVDPKTMNHAIADYLATVSARDDVDGTRAASDLYRWLGAPLVDLTRDRGVRRVRLWLDGALRYVPFGALWDGRGYLVERYEFSYSYAGRAPDPRPGAAAAAAARPHALAAFGVTRALGGMPALPGVGEELCGIVNGRVSGLGGEPVACATSGVAHGALDGLGFANEYFTEDRLRAFRSAAPASQRVDLLHVGTHFALRPGNVRRSWLLLGDGSRLPLASFERLDFDGLDLVTMSACQTGMAGATGDDGREIEGLPALLLSRGVRTVVASLWRIDDRSASTLMRTFYVGLGRGLRASDALRRAQLAMLRATGDGHARPYHWAGFVPSAGAP